MGTDNQTTPLDTPLDAMVAYGQVVTVRPIPTRQVTQIVIEIPDNFHIAATSMLFGKNAFVLAATDKARGAFGVVPLGQMSGESPATEATPGATDRTTRTTTIASSGGLRIDVNPSQWLGIECQNAMFMSWLNVASSSAAAERVREICCVESRSEIAKSEKAKKLFAEKLYFPYVAFKRRSEEDLRRVQTA